MANSFSVCFHSFQQKVHPYSSSYCFSLLFDQCHHLFQKWSIKGACGFASPVLFRFIPVKAPCIPTENQSAEVSADRELPQSTAYEQACGYISSPWIQESCWIENDSFGACEIQLVYFIGIRAGNRLVAFFISAEISERRI